MSGKLKNFPTQNEDRLKAALKEKIQIIGRVKEENRKLTAELLEANKKCSFILSSRVFVIYFTSQPRANEKIEQMKHSVDKEKLEMKAQLKRKTLQADTLERNLETKV